MNRKKLYIHIGTQKTGTTTIQSILSKNKNELQNENICYLGRLEKLAREIRVITEPDVDLENKIRSKVKDKLKECSDHEYQSYIISNEKFTGDKMIAYRNSSLIAKSLERVFEPFEFDIKIIVFIRRQDTFFESTYAQRIYSGESLTFQEFYNLFDESDFHWDELLNSYAEVFGKENILVRRFDKKYLPGRNSLINTFGEAIKSTYLQNYTDTTYKNRGYSRDALEIARLVNKNLEKKEMRQLRDILRKAGSKEKSYSFFNNEQRKQFLSNYESSNKRVAREYFDKHDEPLFSVPDYTNGAENKQYEGLTIEALCHIMSKAILVMDKELNEKLEHQRKNDPLQKATRFLKGIYHRIFIR